MVVTQLLMLGSHTGGAIIEMANTQVFTAQRNHGCGAKTKALGAENSRFDHV